MEKFKKTVNFIKISVYELIDKAREHFISSNSFSMCFTFYDVLEEDYGICSLEKKEDIIKQIDKFNSEWLTNEKISKNYFWWDPDDIQSRINAFDKLLEYYIHHPKTIYINL